MQFKYPELLYALFLLIIPILVHFFQLRKFKKEAFTNVKFLKKVELQARKSSVIKKWLVLCTRLFALAAAIIAFAQPFIPNSDAAMQDSETVIYIDNSFSMQQKTSEGTLLKKSIQDVLENLPDNEAFTLLTNNNIYRNTTRTEIKKELLQTTYSPENMSLNTVYTKAINEFSEDKNTQKNFIAISDFQQNFIPENPKLKSYNHHFVQLSGQNNFNISIDSLYISEKTVDKIELKANLSASGKSKQTLAVSVHNSSKLLAKSSVDFSDNSKAETTFTLPANQVINGKITIEDNSLQYDNSFYFSINTPEKINIVAINGEEFDYISRIFKDKKHFDLQNFSEQNLNYNAIEDANLVILNELSQIPDGLENILQKHLQNGNSLCVIPPKDINRKAYNKLLNSLNLGSFPEQQLTEDLKITDINFAHPLFTNVFDNEIENFEYPSISESYTLTSTGNPVLRYNSQTPFLTEKNQAYIFSAPINTENSNFKNSPLIVPTLYNMAQQSLKLPDLYYTIGKPTNFDVMVSLEADNVLHLKNESESFIPMQRKYNTKTTITTEGVPENAGNYSITKNEETIQLASFNYNRNESELEFADMTQWKNATVKNSIATTFSELRNKSEINQFWKWFAIFAALFLVIEMLLLKFIK